MSRHLCLVALLHQRTYKYQCEKQPISLSAPRALTGLAGHDHLPLPTTTTMLPMASGAPLHAAQAWIKPLWNKKEPWSAAQQSHGMSPQGSSWLFQAARQPSPHRSYIAGMSVPGPAPQRPSWGLLADPTYCHCRALLAWLGDRAPAPCPLPLHSGISRAAAWAVVLQQWDPTAGGKVAQQQLRVERGLKQEKLPFISEKGSA